MIWLAIPLGLLALWLLPPLLLLWCLRVPLKHKMRATVSMTSAWCRGAWVKVFGLSALVVVPRLVKGLPREAESLPCWDSVYGNNWGINGDARPWHPLAEVFHDPDLFWRMDRRYDIWGLDPASTAEGVPLLVPADEDTPTYYCMHPARSEQGRRDWLTRNRCTNLAIRMGVDWPTGTKQAWGNPWVDKSRPGWCLIEQGGRYHLMAALPIGQRVFVVNWGYALNLTRDRSMKRCPAELKPFGLSKRAQPVPIETLIANLPPSKRAEVAAIVRN